MISQFPSDSANAESAGRIMTKTVKAGKRTYFFDVYSMRNSDDYYITITESRKKSDEDGSTYYAKQKLHLYKEDFDKFCIGLEAAIEFVKASKPEYFALHRSDAESADDLDFDTL
ncbi:MAG: DUF3276 family protein [Alistipes sp.]|nr:DUF3276 family protein [Alistipes sp.]